MQVHTPITIKTVGDVLCASALDLLHRRDPFTKQTPSPVTASSAPTPTPPSTAMSPGDAAEHRRTRRCTPTGLRPIDEALFCAYRMESEGDVLRQLRQRGPTTLTEQFRRLCGSLSLHHVRLAEFTFLCAAVLQCSVQQHDCEVVFAFLRAERNSSGGISVAQLLPRLRTLFEPLEVLCALQLKCLLETHRLDYCDVSLNELDKAVEGLRSQIHDAALAHNVAVQWGTLGEELRRLQANGAVPVPTLRLLTRRSARALRAAVRALRWDGTVKHRPGSDSASESDVDAPEPVRAFDAGRLHPCTGSVPGSRPASAPSPTALLSAVATAYQQRLATRARHAASPSRAAGGGAGRGGDSGSPAWASVQSSSRNSTWRAPESSADPTHPRFTADLYAVLPTSRSRPASRLAA